LDEVRDIGLVVEEPDAKEWEVIWKIYKCYKKWQKKLRNLKEKQMKKKTPYEYEEILKKLKKLEGPDREEKEKAIQLPKQKVIKLADSAWMWVIAPEK